MGEVNYYGYVERPYASVRTLLLRDPEQLLQRATASGARRAEGVYAEIRTGGALKMSMDVAVHVDRAYDGEPVDGQAELTSTHLDLSWKAASAPALFPLMHAKLSAWPVTPMETQISIEGHYEPPLGLVGAAVDAVIGHRLAQASVQRFLDDVVEYVRRTCE
jgi:hypothetical protein